MPGVFRSRRVTSIQHNVAKRCWEYCRPVFAPPVRDASVADNVFVPAKSPPEDYFAADDVAGGDRAAELPHSSLFRGPWPGFPHLHCPVIPAAGNTFPVRAETHAHDGISVSFEGELLSAGFRIPQLCRPVRTSADNLFAIGAETDADDTIRVSIECEQAAVGAPVPVVPLEALEIIAVPVPVKQFSERCNIRVFPVTLRQQHIRDGDALYQFHRKVRSAI